MEFEIKSINIFDLIKWIEEDHIDLKPYYQRNDIWTRNDQELLIDSILKGYPLPNFFIFKRNTDRYEMVDGQQRARTIFRYYQNKITNSQKSLFNDIDSSTFLKYKLSVTELKNVKDDSDLEQFYVLVNKRGKHLSTPEIHKAEFSHSNFLRLVEELVNYQNLMNLNIFTESSSKRMSDRNYVEELVAYLLYGIQDKKKIIEKIYSSDLSEDKCEKLRKKFTDVIDRIELLNKEVEIKKTRYKQRSDFYTLFNYINQNINISDDILLHQYKILRNIGKYITPSNEDCPPLREYALNCVSQSNSKKARISRLCFFNSILLNKEKDISNNNTLYEIVRYIESNQLFNPSIVEVGKYYLLYI